MVAGGNQGYVIRYGVKSAQDGDTKNGIYKTLGGRGKRGLERGGIERGLSEIDRAPSTCTSP